MNTIKAEISKDKESKSQTYSFEVNGEAFKALYLPGKEAALQIMHNEVSLGAMLWTVDKERKFEYTVNVGAKPVKITAWISNGFSFMGIGKANGIGIEVDGIPVQHTVTAPEIHIENGRSWLYVLVFILGFKSIWTYYTLFSEYASHFVAGVSSTVYIVPFIIALIVAIKYKTWTTFAIYAGLILAVLEAVDFATGIPESANSGSSGFVIWLFIRMGLLYAMFNAFKWRIKQKKAGV